MPKEDFLVTKDLNEVAKIHSNPLYANWKFEFVDNEYRFYSPNYKKEDMSKQEAVPLSVKKTEDTYVTLEQLEPLLSESGYMCFGHGTGRAGNSDEIVDSIFSKGLRTKDNSLYYTTIGLTTPTKELKDEYKELGLPEPSIENLKKQFNNWQHQDSKKIIIARIPIEYINNEGNRSDLDGEMYGAFFTQELQESGKEVNYLDSKFIVGCFDVDKQAVRLNKNFEKNLSEESIKNLKEGYKKALEKTKKRLDNFSIITKHNEHKEQLEEMMQQKNEPTYESYDNFDFPEIDWEDTETLGKTK